MKQGKTVAIAIIIMVILVGGGLYLWEKNKVAQPLMKEMPKPIINQEPIKDGNVEVKPIDNQKPFKGNLITSGPISFFMAPNLFTISTTTQPFDYTAEQLKTTAELDCATPHPAGYFDKLVAKFKGINKIIYSFKYKGESQDNGIYKVTLLPNKPGYATLEQFQKDFNLCEAVADAYPSMLNNNLLLFVNACGTGYDDGSGRPHGCEEVKKIVEPSLKLN